MIVQKPQFDTETIKVGSAYWLTQSNFRRMTELSTPCLIVSVDRLAVQVTYMNPTSPGVGTVENKTIKIEDVVNETYKLEPMLVVAKG